jgi:hypothetical protein
MPSYKFDSLPSNSSVASAVTLAVCAWFWVAGATMIVAPHAEPAPAAATQVVYTAPAVSIAPEARLLIVVEGHRV